jgi:hypothetical protein
MHSISHGVPASRRLAYAAAPFLLGTAALGFFSLGAPAPAGAEEAAPPPAAAPAAGAAKTFASKEEAAKALVEAASKNDDAALTAMTGAQSADVVQDGRDPIVAKNRAAFAAAANKKLTFEEKDGKVTLVVGDEEWPFPIPLVQEGSAWRFDADAGREEILARRIGANELNAIKICREYVEAQVEYASKDRDGDKVREYAQRLLSTPGNKDGLWWPQTEGGEASPLQDELAPLRDFMGSAPGAAPTPFAGYYWRILGWQGPHAPGGAHDYRINGNMIAGFALIGVPASYQDTAIMTVMVSHHGTIYEKDLGPNSLEAGRRILAFDPDPSWNAVSEADLAASLEK